MISIVAELSNWAKLNSVMLEGRGVRLTKKFPEPDSTHPWKASIALVYGEIIVSFTVWERSAFQTELIIMNSSTGKTIVMDEKMPDDAYTIHANLDEVVRKLLDDFYRRIGPDPKLVYFVGHSIKSYRRENSRCWDCFVAGSNDI